MKLSQLAAKPQLMKVILDDELVIETYKEPLEFYTWDRQPIDLFMKLAASQNANAAEMIDIVRTLILDEEGNQVIKDGVSLPGPILVRAISKIVESLGKS